MSRRLPRQTFLKLSAALGLASLFPNISFASSAPRLGACWPGPWPHTFFPNPADLLTAPDGAFDLLLVPAYAVVELVRANRLRPLPGPAGRAHDPQGAFSRPYQYAVSALRGAASLKDLWKMEAAWPADQRLLTGAALLLRGWLMDDPHPGRRAQAAHDLRQRRLSRQSNPPAAFAMRPWPLPSNGAWRLPQEGGAWLEYDWVIPRAAADPTGAEAFARAQPLPPPPALPWPGPGRLLPLTPQLEG